MPTDFDTVIFDLDGTLLNSIDDLTDSINAALSRCGFPTHALREVKHYIGDGAEMLVRRALPPHTDEADYKAVYNAFIQVYSENMYNKTQPYAGIPELLAELRRRGVKMAVVSNKFQAAVTPLIADYFGDCFAAVVGADANTPKKPDPSGVLQAMARLDSTSERTIYLGDSPVDVLAARAAGVFAAACTWGLRERTALEAVRPNAIIDTPQALLSILDNKVLL